MSQANRQGHRGDNPQGPGNRDPVLDQHPWQQTSHQTDHRADRQVDARGDDDERRADRKNSEQGAAAKQVLDVELGQKPIAHQCRDDADENQETKNAEDLFHVTDSLGLVWLPVANRMTDSSLSWSRVNSPVMFPSCMTITRSDMLSTSSISLETNRIATPRSANSSISR